MSYWLRSALQQQNNMRPENQPGTSSSSSSDRTVVDAQPTSEGSQSVEDMQAPMQTPPVQVPPVAAPVQPPPGFQHRYSVTLQPYDGKSEAVKWWTRFMAFITLQRMPEAEAILTLPFYLTGMADNWFGTLANDCKQSLHIIQTSFLQRFKPVTKHDIRLKSLEQQQHETIDEYISRAETMNSNNSVSEEFLVQITATGLKPDIARTVFQHRPSTMTDLREQAKLADMAIQLTAAPQTNSISFNDLQQMERRLSEAMAVKMEATVMAATSAYQQTPQWQRPQAQQNQRFNHRHSSDQGFQNKHHNQQHTHSQTNNCKGCGMFCKTRSICPARNMSCHYCTKPGHFSNVCEKRKRDNAKPSHR